MFPKHVLRAPGVDHLRQLAHAAPSQVAPRDRPADGTSCRTNRTLAQLHALEHRLRHRVVGEERAVVGVEDRVEPLGVQVRDVDVVPGLRQSFGEAVENRTAERLAVGVSEDGQDSHGWSSTTAHLAVAPQ